MAERKNSATRFGAVWLANCDAPAGFAAVPWFGVLLDTFIRVKAETR